MKGGSDEPSSPGCPDHRVADAGLPTRTRARSTPDFEEVAIVLAQMTPEERVRAYASGVFSLRELNAAAGVRPDLMPIVNGEWEWIALTAE